MRRALLLVLSPALAAIPSTAADAPAQSWGKAGVSFDAYLADARVCASRGWNADIEDTEAVKVFREGTNRIESLIGTTAAPAIPDPSGMPDPAVLGRQAQIARIVEGTRPRQRFAEVRGVQLGTVERCLTERGYVRFQLTADQRKRLAALPHGSDARRAYLHALASDAKVLAAQPIPVPASPR